MPIINEKYPILGAQAPEGTCVGTTQNTIHHEECCAEAGFTWGGEIHACSSCTDTNYFDQIDCEANGETWTPQDPYWDPGMGNVTTLEGGDYAYLVGAKTLYSEDTFHGYQITDYHVLDDGSFTYDASKPAQVFHGWTDDRVARSEHTAGEVKWNPSSVDDEVGDNNWFQDLYDANPNITSFWDSHEGLFVEAPLLAFAPQKKMMIDKYSMGFDEMALNEGSNESRLMWGPGLDGYCEGEPEEYTYANCGGSGGTWIPGSAPDYDFADHNNYDRNALWSLGNYDDAHGQLPDWFGSLVTTGGSDFTDFGPGATPGTLSRNAGWFIGDFTRWEFITNKGWSKPEEADEGEAWGRIQHGQTGYEGQILGDFGAETYGHMGNAVILKANAGEAACLIGGYFKIDGADLAASTATSGSAAVSADMEGSTPGSHYDMLRDGVKQASITSDNTNNVTFETLANNGNINLTLHGSGVVNIDSVGQNGEYYNLLVNGGIKLTGDLDTNGNLSDERLKKNVKIIGDSLSKIEAIRGVSFDWKAKADDSEVFQGLYDGHDLGVIAQDVEKVLPEIVRTRDSGVKAVQYEKLIPVLVEAVKELSKKVTNLETHLNKTSF